MLRFPMDPSPAISALLRELSSSNMDVRMRALTRLETSGSKLVPELSACLASDRRTELERVWSAIALCRTGDDDRRNARSAASIALASRSAAVRRACLELLSLVGDDASVDLIAAHTDDEEVAAPAFFEDERSVAQAARAALRALNSPKSLAALQNAEADD
jgi:hypothetical protein